MRQSRTLKLTALVAVITMLLGGTALADVITNDVSTATGDALTVQAGSSATVHYNVHNTNSNNSSDPQNSCNPADTTPLTISVTGLPTGVTAGSAAVSACGFKVGQITFQVGSGVTSGDYSLGHNFADSGTGTYANSANFTLRVTAPADSTPPVINPTISGTEGDNGWYTSNVSLTWDVSDNQSAISSSTGCGVTSITADQGATVYTCSATSAGGTHSESVTIKRDATAPQVAYTSASGTAGDNGWYTSDVTARFTATDTRSGFPSGATTTGTASTIGEGSNLTVGSPAFTDLAGNTAAAGTATSPGFKVDKSAPNAPTASLDPEPNSNGWNNSPVTVAFRANGDNGPSGVAGCTASSTISDDTASQTVEGTCTDNAGNRSATTTATVKLDKAAPSVEYSSASGSAGANGWYLSDVTATFTATDGLSGFASGATQTGTATTSGEGVNRTVGSPAFTDLAGNTATAGSATSPAFKVDKSDPTNVTFVGGPSDGAGYYFGAVPGAPTCTAEDAVSGLASCLVTGHNTGVGSHTLTATATDNAGRRSTATLSYTVRAWNTKGFYSPVDMGGVLNSVKGGSTVPLKFEVFAGVAPAGELTTTTAIGASIKYAKISCDGSAPVDEIETLASGSTALRFDDTSGQFVYNWKTPTGAGCYRATVYLADGSSIWANFKTR